MLYVVTAFLNSYSSNWCKIKNAKQIFTKDKIASNRLQDNSCFCYAFFTFRKWFEKSNKQFLQFSVFFLNFFIFIKTGWVVLLQQSRIYQDGRKINWSWEISLVFLFSLFTFQNLFSHIIYKGLIFTIDYFVINTLNNYVKICLFTDSSKSKLENFWIHTTHIPRSNDFSRKLFT